jgi:linoleoyl-CoA desaturase
MMGSLDLQIEHHVAPRLPHTIYPLVARRLRQLCAERNITYRRHPNGWAALCAHARWLKLMSQRPIAPPAGSGSGPTRASRVGRDGASAAAAI